MTSSDTDHPPLSERTAFLANKVGQLLHERLERAFIDLELSSRSYYALTVLERDVPKSQQELAQLVMVDATTMGALIDLLESRGLVERSRNKRDRRRYDLTLSDKGVDTLAAANDAVAAVESEFFLPLDETDRATMDRLLAAVLEPIWPPPEHR